MKLIPYNEHEHFHSICDLLDSRNLPIKAAYDLPEFGLVAIENDQVIAAGFLRKVEGYSAMMDSFITHPNAPGFIRDKAMNRLIVKLIKIAKHYDVKALFAFSQHLNTLTRAVNLGFTQLPHSVLALDIS